MNKHSLIFFKRLLNSVSPSGYEKEAARIWAEEARTFTDDVQCDQHGNVFACVNKGGSPRVMLAGHMDEIGLMITYIDDQGFLSFMEIGGWDPQILQGQHVWIRTSKGRVLGVIGKKPIHLLKSDEREKVSKAENLWIDIGAKKKKEAAKLVEIGDPCVLAYEVEELRNGLLVSRSMDDKSGAFVVLEAARLLSQMKVKAEIHAVATVQEEIGLRGSATSTYAVDPQVGIAVDVTFATDFPSMDKKSGEVIVGKGPVISRGPNINPQLFDLLVKAAKKKKIPYQIVGEPRGTGTDANRMQLTRAGVATGLVSIPTRYLHSPCEILSQDDLEKAARLIAETLAGMDEKTRFTYRI